MDASAQPDEATTHDFARWLGYHAARRGVVDAGRTLLPDSPGLREAYLDGARVPRRIAPHSGATERRQRAWLRRLEAAADPEPTDAISARAAPLPARIVHLVQRADVGTATRYDVTLRDSADFVLHDLRSADLLCWERLRPIALDAGRVLSPLSKGQRALWLAALQAAIASAERAPLDDEDSDAMEIRALLRDLTAAARPWEWSDDDIYPRGIVSISHNDKLGWPRGPLVREVRGALGRVSRVSLRRARLALGWRAFDWRIQAAYLRVWAVAAAP